ncbi:uncharacterized protein FFE2_00033 [Fusarium fujikuroi]|nr:uncharacterized protein FFE2_00033 [Fusarium fujikuroi]
MSLKDK